MAKFAIKIESKVLGTRYVKELRKHDYRRTPWIYSEGNCPFGREIDVEIAFSDTPVYFDFIKAKEIIGKVIDSMQWEHRQYGDVSIVTCNE